MEKNKKKIKVLNVLTDIEDGGLEMLVYNIYKNLNGNVYNLNVCTLLSWNDTFISQGFRRVCSETYHFNFININAGLRGFFKNVKGVFALAILMYKNRYDIIHSHEFFPASMTRFSVIMNKILHPSYKPVVFITYHNIYFWLKPKHRLINRFLSIFTTKIICVSNSVLEDSLQEDKIPKDKYEVIYNGIDSESFYPDKDLRNNKRKELGYTEKDFVIGNVGVLSIRKGQIYILQAFNKIRKLFPELKVLLIGSTRDYELDIYEELIDYIKHNRLSNSVKILDTTPNINELYNCLDLFVMSSITEGFGLAAFESMLTERICIFSDIPVFKEIIKEGETGFFFESMNSDSLAEVITKVLNNIHNYNNIKKAGRKYVKEKFPLITMVGKYNKLYMNSL